MKTKFKTLFLSVSVSKFQNPYISKTFHFALIVLYISSDKLVVDLILILQHKHIWYINGVLYPIFLCQMLHINHASLEVWYFVCLFFFLVYLFTSLGGLCCVVLCCVLCWGVVWCGVAVFGCALALQQFLYTLLYSAILEHLYIHGIE